MEETANANKRNYPKSECIDGNAQGKQTENSRDLVERQEYILKNKGEIPRLLLAAAVGDVAVVEALLEGENVGVTDESGADVFDYAAANRVHGASLVDLFHARGAKMRGAAPVERALEAKNFDVCVKLFGLLKEETNLVGNLLNYCVRSNKLEFAKFVFAADASLARGRPSAAHEFSEQLLFEAVQFADRPMCEWLFGQAFAHVDLNKRQTEWKGEDRARERTCGKGYAHNTTFSAVIYSVRNVESVMQSELSAEEDAILVQMTRMRLQNLGKGPSAAKVSAGKKKAEVLHFTLDNSTKDDEQLLKNTNASHLKISCARPEEDRLQALLLLPKIEALTLEHVREQHVVERLLASFGPDLLSLSIRYVSVSSDCLPVRRLIRSCPKLEKLSLEGISLLEQENAACLPELRKFKWTNSEWCKEVGQVLRSPKLQKVVLEGAVHVDVLTQATELIRQRAILRQLRALHVHQTHAFGRFSAHFLASQFEAGALLAKTAAAFLPQLTDVQFSLKECLFSNFPFSPSVGIRHDQNLDKILKEFKKFNRSK